MKLHGFHILYISQDCSFVHFICFSLSRELLSILISMVIQTDKGKMKECMLCKRIFQELLPLDTESDELTAKFDDKVPSNIHLQLMKVSEKAVIPTTIPSIFSLII